MINCIVIFIMLYIIYKLVRNEPIPYLSNLLQDNEGFKVSAWDGRGTDLKKCLNSIEGIRHFEYPEYANTCNQSDPFNKYL